MGKFFIEVAYRGTRYHGFQTQPNGLTIQGELETALHTLLRKPVPLTGSSRTDTGVHALQNFFHTETDATLKPEMVYNLNAILPTDVVVKSIRAMAESAHARFDATFRKYRYYLHSQPNPFLVDRSWYYPYPLQRHLLDATAAHLLSLQDFTSFSKRNTQTKTMRCQLTISHWKTTEYGLVYEVSGNRFLRGMVRALVGTMLQCGRGKIDLDQFKNIAAAHDCRLADFSTPPHGLFLCEVGFPEGYWNQP